MVMTMMMIIEMNLDSSKYQTSVSSFILLFLPLLENVFNVEMVMT